MDQFLKNQKYVFISIFGSLIIIGLAWYFLLHQGLSKQYKNSKTAKNILTIEAKKFTKKLQNLLKQHKTIIMKPNH